MNFSEKWDDRQNSIVSIPRKHLFAGFGIIIAASILLAYNAFSMIGC